MLSEIFRFQREEVTKGTRKLDKKEFHDLRCCCCCRYSNMTEDEVGGACGCREENKNAFRYFGGKPERKRLLGIPKRRREDNIETDNQEVRLVGVDWFDWAQDRDKWWTVNTVMKLCAP